MGWFARRLYRKGQHAQCRRSTQHLERERTTRASVSISVRSIYVVRQFAKRYGPMAKICDWQPTGPVRTSSTTTHPAGWGG